MSDTGIIPFDYAAWSVRFPEFSNVNSDQATMLYDEAGLFLDNTSMSLIQDHTKRGMILNLITAHLAFLNVGVNGSPANTGLVGRITSATQGSVSVSVDAGMASGTAAWYAQSRYGMLAWQAMAPYRLGGRWFNGNVPDLDVIPRQYGYAYRYGRGYGF